MPSKVYPYVFSGTPVLALVPGGDAADIISGAGTGLVIRSRDAREVADLIDGFVAALRQGTLEMNHNESFVRQYSIDALAARVDGVLDEMLES